MREAHEPAASDLPGKVPSVSPDATEWRDNPPLPVRRARKDQPSSFDLLQHNGWDEA